MNSQTQNNKPVAATDIVDILRRRKMWILLTALFVMSGIAIYSYVAKDQYKAKTLLSVEAAPGANMPTDPAGRVQEQMRLVHEVLFSESVFKPVVDEFHLVDRGAISTQRELEEIRSRVKIESDGESAFYIGYEGDDRKQVADVANRLAELLSAKTSARREKRNAQETAVIDSEVDRLRGQLANLDGRIQQYKQSAVEELPERVDANLRLLDSIQTQMRENATSTSTEEARRAGVVAEMNDLEKEGNFVIETPAAKSVSAEQLEAKTMEMQRLQARGYTRSHPEIVKLEGEIASLQGTVSREKPATPIRTTTAASLRYTALKAELETIDRHLTSLRQQRGAMTGSLGDYRQRVNSSPRHEQALGQLTREYDIAKVQYEEQLKRQSTARHETQLERLDNSVVFRIVEPAKAPLDPFAPNRLRLFLIGLAASLGAGLAFVFMAEQFDSSFKDVEELQGKTGLSVLTMVPRIQALTRKKRKTLKTALAAQGISVQPQDGIVSLVDPKSVPAEQYQILATQLRRKTTPGGGLVIMVTSAAGGEGKTLTSVNLAASLAATGANVLLMDADLRRPRVHQYLGVKATDGQGIAGLIGNPEGDLSKYSIKVGGITVLPGKSSVQNPLNLLGSPKLAPIIERLRGQFQFIVIDSPPALPLADGMVLSALADKVVVVVRAHQTTHAVLRRALDSVDRTKIAGLILNDVDMKHSRYAYVYRYYENTYLRGA